MNNLEKMLDNWDWNNTEKCECSLSLVTPMEQHFKKCHACLPTTFMDAKGTQKYLEYLNQRTKNKEKQNDSTIFSSRL